LAELDRSPVFQALCEQYEAQYEARPFGLFPEWAEKAARAELARNPGLTAATVYARKAVLPDLHSWYFHAFDLNGEEARRMVLADLAVNPGLTAPTFEDRKLELFRALYEQYRMNGIDSAEARRQWRARALEAIQQNPGITSVYQISNILSSDTASSASDKVKLVFMKHGIPPTNKALIADISALIER